MGFLDWLRRLGDAKAVQSDGQTVSDSQFYPVARTSFAPAQQSVLVTDGRFMPKYRGRYIYDWGDEVARLKRENRFDEALQLATGCMNAMVAAAEQNPVNVMEQYVIEVAIIQHKMKDYAGEVAMLEGWLNRGFPASREDFRLDVRKRLAKAQEILAKAEGRDSSGFNAEWKRLVELAKQQKQSASSSSGVSSGRSADHPSVAQPRKRSTSRLVPSRSKLLVRSFVAVDFETANKSGGASACQVALVKVNQGHIVDRYSTLLKPPSGYDSFEFTYLHGISARDVARAPMWPDVANGISQFIAGAPVYAHNASFDAKVWRDLDGFFDTISLPHPFFCSYRTAQRVIPGLKDYKLPTVVKACVPHYRLDHHRADSDAEACALIVAALQHRVFNGQ